MKSTILLTLSFLLFAFTLEFPLALSQQVEPVEDTQRNLILPGGLYYIMPVGERGGGLGLGKTANQICPLTMLQNYSEPSNGLAVKFSISESSPGSDTIFTGRPLDISFEKKPECATSSNWVVVSDGFYRPWVGIGGAEDHTGPGVYLETGVFNIQRHGNRYKLVFCPTITYPPGACSDIGRYNDVKARRLTQVADGDAYEVVFVYAGTDGIRSIV